MRWILLPAFAMSLGWGWRGYIGGGPFGAMIPGAMVVLVLCLLAGLDARRSALAAALGAVGVGFGGEMTYGQTVGFVRDPQAFEWGLLGLALKGAVWGLLGGAVVGIGFYLASGRRAKLELPLVGLVVGSALGWAVVNAPKLVYFSDRVDRPREEVWAGLLLGALVLIGLFVVRQSDARPVLRFALAGLAGGWFGFGGGGLWIYLGSRLAAAPDWVAWWKLMEFTFGLLFGAALGWAAWASRDWMAPVGEAAEVAADWAPPVVEVLLWSAAAAGLFTASDFIPVRFAWVIVGAGLLALAHGVPRARWWIAIAVTAAAFFLDWYDYVRDEPPFGSKLLGATITAAAIVAVCTMTLRALRANRLDARRAFWLLVGWAAVTSWGRVVLLGDYTASSAAEHAGFFSLLGAVALLLPKK